MWQIKLACSGASYSTPNGLESLLRALLTTCAGGARRCALFFGIGCCIVASAAGCATEDPGISPPRDQLYFPTSMALDPGRRILYVANSNADLQYNGGTITPVRLDVLPDDLSRIGEAVAAGALDCRPSELEPAVWACPSGQFILEQATLRIGDYPSGIRVSSDGRRIFVTERSKDSLVWAEAVELADGGLDLRCDDRQDQGCGRAGEQDCPVWDCQGKYLVNYSETQRKTLPADPYGIALNELVAVFIDEDGARHTCRDGLSEVPCSCPEEQACQDERARGCCLSPPPGDHIYATHLSGGEVSFFTSGPEGVRLQDVRGGFFTPSGSLYGSFSLAPRIPGDWQSLVYVSSRVNSMLASYYILDQQLIIDATRAPVGAILPGTDVRGLAFGPGGQRLYLVNRQPPALVAMDMSADGGLPAQQPLWATELCSEPSMLALGPDPLRPDDPLAQLVYVACFGAGLVYVVDAELGQLVQQIITGRGPNEILIDAARQRAFVTNFIDNTIGVIDLDPAHSNYQTMVMRIGEAQNLLQK